MAGIEQMQVGNHVGDIGARGPGHAEKHGYGVVRELVGHGVGREMHEEPQVPESTASRAPVSSFVPGWSWRSSR